jgi:ankyrin repeat protein
MSKINIISFAIAISIATIEGVAPEKNLLEAIANKEYAAAQQILNKGVSDRLKVHALDDAISDGDPHFVDLLIKAGADVNKGYGVLTPLGLALFRDKLEIAQMLIDAGADVNEYDQYMPTIIGSLLYQATKSNKPAIVKMLIKGGAVVDAPNTDWNATALKAAVNNNNVEIAKILLDAGASLYRKDKLLSSPWETALDKNNLEMLKMLAASGANFNDTQGCCLGVFYKTALEYAISSKNSKLVKSLIEIGVNLNLLDKYQQTPLAQALDSEQHNIAKLLVLAGADATRAYNVNIYKARLLQKASLLTQTNYYESIAEDTFGIKKPSGIPTKIASYLYQQPIIYVQLYYAIVKNDLESFKKLLQEKVKALNLSDVTKFVNQKDELGGTLLMYAAILGRLDMVNLLLAHGGDPSIEAKNGKTLFVIIEEMFKTGELLPTQEERYKKILEVCYVQLYNLQLAPMQGALKKTLEGKVIIPNIMQHLLPLLAGTEKAPGLKSIERPEFLKERLAGLQGFKPQQPAQPTAPAAIAGGAALQAADQPRAARTLFDKQKLIASLAGGTLALFGLYKYLTPQVPTNLTPKQLEEQLVSALHDQNYEYAYQLAKNNPEAVQKLAADTKKNLEELIVQAELNIINETVQARPGLNPFSPSASTQLISLSNLMRLLGR